MLAPGLAQDQFDYILPFKFAARARTMGLGFRHLWVLRKNNPKPQADGDSAGKGTYLT